MARTRVVTPLSLLPSERLELDRFCEQTGANRSAVVRAALRQLAELTPEARAARIHSAPSRRPVAPAA
jgi:metal-responsive CopG/Arc/MetJ family transcriptional regulator